MSDPDQKSTQESAKEQALPEGWTKGFSKSQKRYYYCHLKAKLTQWHFPTESEVKDPYAAKERQKQQNSRYHLPISKVAPHSVIVSIKMILQDGKRP